MRKTKTPPVSTVHNEIHEFLDLKNSTSFNIYYDDHTIYGDLKYIKSKIKSAVEKKSQENVQKNDFKVENKEKIQRPDLFAGELEFAINRLNETIEKVDETDDYYNILEMLKKQKDILEEHKKQAELGHLLYK